jgi:hypothetical protein
MYQHECRFCRVWSFPPGILAPALALLALACNSTETPASSGTGGQALFGGSATGGSGTGGALAPTGGTGTSTGGSGTGGATGGKSTGGSVTGGASTGGKSTGGTAAGGSPAGGSATAGSSSDYGYCNYGAVPSGTPPAAWQDAPALAPTGVNPYGTPSLTIANGYLLLSQGPNGTSQVPQATQTSILARINEDLKFETQHSYFHLPPWSTGATGTHYIDYVFTNTGLPNDPGATGDASWEGSYPFVETDSNGMTDAQRYNLTHEFNHVIQNAYGTVNGQRVSWVQESHNNYLILRLVEWRNGATPGQAAEFTVPSSIDYLNTLVYQQPHVPIESCGINSAGEATGPGDYMNDSTGFRYNDLFPLFVAQRVGQYFYAAVWEQAKSTEQNLQTMTRLLDKARVQCMVQEYAARLALGDFLEFSTSQQQRASASMYAATTNQSGWLVPSDATKLPRYTGRNNIPIAVTSGATQVSVNFAPSATGSKGTLADMRAQIVYHATDRSSVFSPPVPSGTTSITLTKPPKNNVVIVVITNVTMDGYKSAQSYGWDPTETFGYQIQVTGGTAAPTNRTYF